jgi:hypothetical protein
VSLDTATPQGGIEHRVPLYPVSEHQCSLTSFFVHEAFHDNETRGVSVPYLGHHAETLVQGGRQRHHRRPVYRERRPAPGALNQRAETNVFSQALGQLEPRRQYPLVPGLDRRPAVGSSACGDRLDGLRQPIPGCPGSSETQASFRTSSGRWVPAGCAICTPRVLSVGGRILR